ncbi:MAG: hypothetical protein ACLFPE_15785 [Bacteroidales bacterium]
MRYLSENANLYMFASATEGTDLMDHFMLRYRNAYSVVAASIGVALWQFIAGIRNCSLKQSTG